MSEHDPDDLESLYRTGTRDEPPPELDRRIRDAARRRERQRRWRSPAAGLATAAVALLTVALLVRQTAVPPAAPGSDARAPGSAAPSSISSPATPDRASRITTATGRAAPAASAPVEVDAPDDGPSRALQRVATESLEPSALPRSARSRSEAKTETETDSQTEGEQTALLAAAESQPARKLAMEDRSGPAAARRAGVTFNADGCSEPYPLPGNAALRASTRGLEVEVQGERFRLECEGGAWVVTRIPGVVRPQISR